MTDDCAKWFPNGALVEVPHWVTDEQVKIALDTLLGSDYDKPVTVKRIPYMDEGIGITCPPCLACRPTPEGRYQPRTQFYSVPGGTIDLTPGPIQPDNQYTALFVEEGVHLLLPDNVRANIDIDLDMT